jgi:hypothetical protein
MTLPAFFYGDPMEIAIKQEERQCTGCKHLQTAFDREFCGIGRRDLVRCKRYKGDEWGTKG